MFPERLEADLVFPVKVIAVIGYKFGELLGLDDIGRCPSKPSVEELIPARKTTAVLALMLPSLQAATNAKASTDSEQMSEWRTSLAEAAPLGHT